MKLSYLIILLFFSARSSDSKDCKKMKTDNFLTDNMCQIDSLIGLCDSFILRCTGKNADLTKAYSIFFSVDLKNSSLNSSFYEQCETSDFFDRIYSDIKSTDVWSEIWKNQSVLLHQKIVTNDIPVFDMDSEYFFFLSEEVRTWKGLEGDGPLADNLVLQAYQAKYNRVSEKIGFDTRSIDAIIGQMNKDGGRVIINLNKGTGRGHVVIANSVYRRTITRPNGTVKYGAYKVGVMNPAYQMVKGYTRVVGQRTLYEAHALYFINR